MNCRQFETHVPEYLEGIADRELLSGMDVHRASCTVCAKTLALHRYVFSSLMSAEPVKAPAGLAERILAAAKAETAPAPIAMKPWYTRAAYLPVAAAVACFAGALANLAHLMTAPANINAVSLTATVKADSFTDMAYSALGQLYGFISLLWGRFCAQPVTLPDLQVSVPSYLLALIPLVLGMLVWSTWTYFASPVAQGIHATGYRM